MTENILIDYMNYIKSEKKLATNTLEAYRRDIIQFKSYLNSVVRSSYLETDKTTIIRYLMYLQKGGKSNSTISRNLASIRCFFQYLINNNLIKEDPTLNLKSPKSEKKIPAILTVNEVNILLGQPKANNFKGARDKAMLELLYATGLRVSEIIALNMEDIQVDLSLILVRDNENNIRAIPAGKIAMEALKTYLKEYRYEAIDKVDEPIFINNIGTRLSRQGFWKLIKQYSKLANIQKDITPQTLRHSFAVHLIENGANMRTVQEMLGHSDISTTQVYSFASDHKELSEVYKKSHPRA